jgi:hypothetical protein
VACGAITKMENNCIKKLNVTFNGNIKDNIPAQISNLLRFMTYAPSVKSVSNK